MDGKESSCSIFISKDIVIVVKNTEDAQGDIIWQKPVVVLKGKPSAEDIGSAVLASFRFQNIENITPKEILDASGFKTWEQLTAECGMIAISMAGGKVTISPYFTGAGGEYYLVLNRDKTVDANPYETGNAVLKGLEYCF